MYTVHYCDLVYCIFFVWMLILCCNMLEYNMYSMESLCDAVPNQPLQKYLDGIADEVKHIEGFYLENGPSS